MVTPPPTTFWERSPNFGDPSLSEILGEVTGDPLRRNFGEVTVKK